MEDEKMKIVFVHLGKAPAEHLWVNIGTLVEKFVNIEIVLVSDLERSEMISHPRIEFFKYIRSDVNREQFSRLNFDFKFRSGFWQYTLERILALDQDHQSFPQKKIMHLESDVLILDDFPFHIFEKQTKMSWLSVDENRDVATLIYLPHAQATKTLSEALLAQLSLDPTLTDMQFLKNFRLKNPTEVLLAPSLSLEMATRLISDAEMDPKIGFELSSASKIFGGVFDPAAIGMWFTGSDPRNYYGSRKVFDTREILDGGTFINPGIFKYRFSDTEGLLVSIDNVESRVWSLHVHSKDMRLFGDSSGTRLRELAALSRLGKVHSEFDFKCLLGLVRENFRNRTMIGFILHHPRIRWLKSFLFLVRGTIRRVI
jgi:hypothetical protein